MALLKDYVLTDTDVVIPNAYHRIEYLSGNKEKMTFHFKIYSSEKAYLIGQAHIGEKDYTMSLPIDDHGNLIDIDESGESLPNFFEMAYNHVKNLSEYLDSEDI